MKMSKSDFDKKKYTIDDRPVSARELIDEAAELDQMFDRDWYKSTSDAAQILRNNGYEVGYYREAENE